MDLVWHLRITSSVIMIYKIHHWWKLSTSVFSTTHWKNVSLYHSTKNYPPNSILQAVVSLKHYQLLSLKHFSQTLSLKHHQLLSLKHFSQSLSLKHYQPLSLKNYPSSIIPQTRPTTTIPETLSFKHYQLLSLKHDPSHIIPQTPNIHYHSQNNSSHQTCPLTKDHVLFPVDTTHFWQLHSAFVFWTWERMTVNSCMVFVSIGVRIAIWRKFSFNDVCIWMYWWVITVMRGCVGEILVRE